MQTAPNFWNFLKAFIQNSIRAASSLRITVLCLFFLFLLTLFGTLYQVQYGLYQSQKKFFTSWVALLGPFPIPGAKLVLSILFCNLLSDAVLNVQKRVRKMGLILVHWGILSLLFGAMLLHGTSRESYLSLFEGEISNMSVDYSQWEICLWQNNDNVPYVDGRKQRQVFAVGEEDLFSGAEINFDQTGLQMKILLYFANARQTTNASQKIASATEIDNLIGIPRSKEPSEDFPGVIVSLHKGDFTQMALLWGRELLPFTVDIQGVSYCLQLRRKRTLLPVTFRLVEFVMEKHPSTEIAKSYSSLVEIQDGSVSRKVKIFMNNPLRIGDRTFYQSSYEIRPGFPEKTVLAVVQSSGRWLLYVSSLVICLGLFLHFVGMMFLARKQRC